MSVNAIVRYRVEVMGSDNGGSVASTEDAGTVLSVVSPVYRGADAVAELVDRCSSAAAEVTDRFEIVLVDDGSPDDGWTEIEKASLRNVHVRGVRLSRNFGQNPAIAAGLAAARGELVVVLDCDLQDDPAYIPEMVAASRRGHDIVYTVKARRRHARWRNLFGRLFHWLLNVLITEPQYRSDAATGSFTLMTRQVVDAYVALEDRQRHHLGLLRWLGFRTTTIEIEHHERASGPSSYDARRLLREALVGITSQSERPLHVATGLGFAFVAASVVATIALTIIWLVDGFLAGWASTIVLLLMCTGFVLVSLGVTGIYVGKVFEQARNRPLFVVMDEIGSE